MNAEEEPPVGAIYTIPAAPNTSCHRLPPPSHLRPFSVTTVSFQTLPRGPSSNLNPAVCRSEPCPPPPFREDNKITDTSAAEARRGKDIQGIPWERRSISREKYRQTRLEQYKNYENVLHSGEESEKECKVTRKGGAYYEFWQNTRSVKSTILHFQLRNLVWSTSKHDVYLMSHYSIIHWSSLSSKKTEVLNVSGHVAPAEKHPGSLLEGFTQTQVSTLAVRDNLLIAGGFQGELICKELNIEWLSDHINAQMLDMNPSSSSSLSCIVFLILNALNAH
ncbi:uncharacterized protein LOC131009830 [Salvia miltiorrhiza]|uniref:uncharacterized protein LOC131009830 n=1 Tax=Salvia miltiorrhiza TaxID=226208 RepID=UPI0025AC9695|nr:uncharacterized protein LOC131009830 [Salvia miltiorrhiza]